MHVLRCTYLYVAYCLTNDVQEWRGKPRKERIMPLSACRADAECKYVNVSMCLCVDI